MTDAPVTAESVAAPKCSECRFGLIQDTGWSNWTVDGRDFFCLLGAHPEDGFDVWYYNDSRLNYAAECPKFEVGEPVSMDVDHEDEVPEERRAIYDAWSARNDGEVLQ